jgi:hypothetical protein
MAFPLFAIACAIERARDVNDDEIKCLSEIPDDGIAAATTNEDFGTSGRQLRRKVTSLS